MLNHLLLLCLLLLSLDGTASTETVEQRLRLHLLHTYDRTSLPPNISSVAVRFTVMHVNMIEAEEVMELDAWIMMSWMDSRLTWSEITASHVQKLAFDPEKIWHPDIVLFNNAEPWKTGARPNTLLLAYPSGEILYVFPTRLRVPCVADLTYWPYDIHNCSAKYGSWVHDGYAFDLELHGDTPEVEIDLVKSFQEERNLTRGQWTVLGSSLQKSTMFYACCAEPYPHITLRMLVQRNAPAFAYTLQMPAIALSLVTSVVFVLPPGALEKALLGGLCLLLHLHFLAYTALHIPHSPSHTPILVRFVSEQLVLTAVSVVLTAVVTRVVRDPHSRCLPHAAQRVLAVCSICFCLGNYRRMASKSELSPYPQGLKGEDLELGEERDFIGRNYPNGTVPSTPSSGNNNTLNESRRAPLDYLLLGAIIDRACLVLYIVVVVGFLVSCKSVLFW